ncbi:MAG: putative Ig domain-containing protein, partial [Limisphaerales bacterium]
LIPNYLSPNPDAPLCPSNITAYASSPSGAVVYYTELELFGDCPFGHHLDSSPASGTTFPIGTTTVTCTAWDDCGLSNSCTFTVTVLDSTIYPIVDWFFGTNLFPPVNSEFSSGKSVVVVPAAVQPAINPPTIIRNVQLRDFSPGFEPPTFADPPQSATFTCGAKLEISTDGGQSFQQDTVLETRIRFSIHRADQSEGGIAGKAVRKSLQPDALYEMDLAQMDISGGSLPTGVMLRESPTLQSTGQTTVRQVNGGYMISSFFDVFTELSMDGGQTWVPAQQRMHLDMQKSAEHETAVSEPTGIVFAPGELYSFPDGYVQHFDGVPNSSGGSNNVVMQGGKYKMFSVTGSTEPVGGTISNDVRLQFDISLDGGTTFNSGAAMAKGHASHTGDYVAISELDVVSTDLPSGMLIRESPTLPSRGQTRIISQSDGSFSVQSFFDVFTEISLDGGAHWTSANEGAAHMTLQPFAPERPEPSPNSPPIGARFEGPMGSKHQIGSTIPVRFANNVVVSNLIEQNFDSSYPPPQPNDPPQTNQLNFQVTGHLSLDGGNTFQPFHATGRKLDVLRQVAIDDSLWSTIDPRTTRFFETETVSLDISGGNLPSGVMLRESPSKASLGRTSVRTQATSSGGSVYEIASFFDVFTEVSLDGGQTWSPNTGGPATLVSGPAICAQFTLTPYSRYAPVGTPFTEPVTASGSLLSYTYAITGGTLPPGISMSQDGVLSGTPTTPGSYTFTITATDARGCSGSQDYTMRVTSGCTDITAPTVTIKSPLNKANLSNATTIVSGVVTDDTSIDRVLIALDNGPSQRATLTYTGTTHKTATWSAPLDLKAAGPHTVVITAQDQCGNTGSATRSLFYATSADMVLTVNGSGSLRDAGKLVPGKIKRVVGQIYKVSAVPSPNNLFSNIVLYQDDVPTISTNPKNFTFTMGSNTAITVNFVTNRFIAAAGHYAGLYMVPGDVTYDKSGPITITVTKSQTFSGFILYMGQRATFSGKFGLDGKSAPAIINVPFKMVQVEELQIPLDPPGPITGKVTASNDWSANFTTSHLVFSSANPCPLSGSNYTVIISGSGTSDTTIPAGDGFASLKITPTGTASFTGKYADGTALSASIPLSSDLRIPFYQALYKNAASTRATFSGSAIGWLTLDTDPKVVHTDSLYWSHGPVPNIPYSTGFSNTSSARAWLYVRPLTGLRVIDVPNMGIVLQDGGLASAMVITDATYGGTPAKITIPSASNPNKVRLTINPTGLLTGSFVPDPALPPVSIFGAVMQASNAASGFFIGADSNGQKLSGYTTAQEQLKAAPRH